MALRAWKPARIALFMMWCLAFAASGRAAPQAPGEKVIVTASPYPVPFDNLSRAVTVFTREEIARLPVRSITDVLAYAASVDVRSRAPWGNQADLSVRGSSYAQVLVLVDGVRVNDSQTGHHNAEFPVPLEEVERVEVLSGPGSAPFGADAIGGIVNIITRRADGGASVSFAAGQFGLVAGNFRMGLGNSAVRQSVSISADRSSGFRDDRDFRGVTVSGRTAIGSRTSILVSYGNREFGAAGFYGPAPSREWTNLTMVSVERKLGAQPESKAVLQAYYRTHGDRFLYDVRTPSLNENRHRTHAAGGSLKSQWALTDRLALSLGGEAGGDFIASSNLGGHSYARISLFGELQWKPGNAAAVYAGMRYDYYTNFGPAASPSLSASWWLKPRLRLRSSLARAFRIPTFTELYYHDPNNLADPGIGPESAWAADAGCDLIPARNWLGSLTLFRRRERNVIDWIRDSPAERWRTANMRRLTVWGMEAGLERSLGAAASLSIRYAWMESLPGAIDYDSKYVLDYARHSLTAAGSFHLPLGLAAGPALRYRRRSDGRSYWLLDGRLERKFWRLAAGIDFSNLLDSRYQEVRGVDLPGRWVTFSLRAPLW